MSTDLIQNQNIEGSSIEDSKVQLGQAGGDSIQIQGDNNQVIIHHSERQSFGKEVLTMTLEVQVA